MSALANLVSPDRAARDAIVPARQPADMSPRAMARLGSNLGAGMACIFFGVSTVMLGYLMLRATFLPRVLGVLGLVGGAGWLAFLYPPLGSSLFMPIALVALIGCAVTIGWLLIRGVDERKWYEMAAASASSIWR